jgi:Domain of unknown function (DUF4375)
MNEAKPVLPIQHQAADEAMALFERLPVSCEADYRALPRRERYLYNVVRFELDVTNGGIDQYLCNSAGGLALECLEALNAIGAHRAFAQLRAACDLFPGRCPHPDQEIRKKQVRGIAGLRHIDEMLPQAEMEAELYDLLMSFHCHPRRNDGANQGLK